MGKYTQLESAAFATFSSVQWVSEAIATFPSNFVGNVPSNEYIRVSILTSSPTLAYANLSQMAGQMVVEIFTPSGEGPLRSSQIADTLDNYLVGKSFLSGTGVVQFGPSLMSPGRPDTANSALFRTMYTISLSYFG